MHNFIDECLDFIFMIFKGTLAIFAIIGIGAGIWLLIKPASLNPELITKEYKIYSNPSAAIWIDPETKCEYIGGNANAAFTPRLNREGKQICR